MAKTLAVAGHAAARARLTTASSTVAATAIFGGALALRLVVAALMTFPPLGDAAYYIAVAQSLYAGHGFTVGSVWNYQPPPRAAVGPSNDYWGPLTSIAEWVSLLVFGNHLYAALIPGAIAGASLASLTYLCGRRAFEEWLSNRGVDAAAVKRDAHWLALGAAMLIAVGSELTYQSVMGDSGMLYGVIGFGALLLWDRASRLPRGTLAPRWLDRTWGWSGASGAAWGAGVLLGCAYLTRGSVIFLATALGLWWMWRMLKSPQEADAASRRALVGAAAALAAGAAVVMAPWLIRQQMVFGHMFSPEATHNALAFSIEDFSEYGAPPTLATMLSHGIGALVGLRVDALWNDWHHVTDYLLYPSALPAVVGLALMARRQSTARLGLIAFSVLLLGFALAFPAVTLFGGYYHSVASVAPFLAWGYLACIYVVAAWARGRVPLRISLAPPLAAIPLLLQIALLAFAVPAIGAGASHDRAMFASVSTWLRAHHAAVVMTNQSSSLYYASGIPAIELPAAQSPEVAYTCAQHYGATYLVLFGSAGSYPGALRDGQRARFVLVDQTPEYEVYHIGP